MVLLAGNGDSGVQVSTVLPALQADDTGRVANGLAISRNVASVNSGSGFIASLNVKTIFVVAGTPLALLVGETETMVGCAWARPHPVSKTNKTSSTSGVCWR